MDNQKAFQMLEKAMSTDSDAEAIACLRKASRYYNKAAAMISTRPGVDPGVIRELRNEIAKLARDNRRLAEENSQLRTAALESIRESREQIQTPVVSKFPIKMAMVCLTAWAVAIVLLTTM